MSAPDAGAGPGVGPSQTDPGRRAVEAVWRIESARIVGALARYTGDFALAEDVAQEALAEALVAWPRDGVPRNPSGWLLTVGRRRAIDAFRRRAALDERYASLAHGLGEGAVVTGGPPSDPTGGAGADLPWDPDQVDDDVLALMFVACHPVLSPEARVALTLRVVGGLSSDEVARAFLVPTATVQARITRAKKTLAAAGVPFGVPPADERRERLGSVLHVLYVIFTEGSTATTGEDWLRPDLAHEALRLARVLAGLVPDEHEAHSLVALLELTAARFPARTTSDGEPVLLADQDRRHWDRSAIRRGRAALARADAVGPPGHGRGAYGLQAAIAECHAVAPSVDETDWDRVVLLYEALGRLAPSPVVELNRAVAVAMAHGPAAALPIVDELVATDRLPGFHLLPSVRAELLGRLGRVEEARAEYELAVRLCPNAREQDLLRRKAAALGA
ncbi:RNA polymerase sigma factor (sigma-70 family) [Cellulosimicrobium cellulans]|uniref:RNA polymerase sigma factor n=1 Tax=Cellulosimicrobium cellulans TaxID=1710 RepID=UPI001958CB54|nr:RNA polymerase sigma factor [Cellulosimicrobium cellulans]MBM7818744.1 RNA polymerase sigma factor (sigma-70 family) [Cellulosimicrobium cellulans]